MSSLGLYYTVNMAGVTKHRRPLYCGWQPPFLSRSKTILGMGLARKEETLICYISVQYHT